jgi:hypothetical protein
MSQIPARPVQKMARRALLLLLVCLSASQIPGCATPAQICDVKSYHTTPIAMRGEVRVTWEVKPMPPGRYGFATCDRSGKNCHLELSQIEFGNVCGLMTFGHEMLHAMGANH